jgi:hypothetical protein
MTSWSTNAFQIGDFCQASAMSFRVAESRGEKGLDQLPGERLADHQAAQAHHVQIVVLNPLVRRKRIMNQAGPDPGDFVRDHRSPHAASTNGHPTIHLPPGNGAGQRHDKIRIIVIRLQAAVAEINHFITRRAQLTDQLPLQFKSAMVGSDAHAVDRFR